MTPKPDARLAMSSAATSVFLVLVAGLIGALYAVHLRPATHRPRLYLAIAVGFLAWILPLMVALR